MKTKWNLSPLSLLLGLGVSFAHPNANASSYTITVPLGVKFIANHLNSSAGNNYIDNLLDATYGGGPLPILDDGASNPLHFLNLFTFCPFNNSTTTFGPSVFYENDFTSNNTGPNSGNPVGPTTGWATDASGILAASYPLPSLNPGEGGFIGNVGATTSASFAGTAPGGFLSDLTLIGGPWNLVSCLSPVAGSYEAVFNNSPHLTHNTFVSIWNGSAFNKFKCDPVGAWYQYDDNTGVWNSISEPTWPIGVSVFVKIMSGPQFVPLAAAAAPGCSVGNTVLVTFNSDVDAFTASDASRYTVTKQGGNNVTVQTAAMYGASGANVLVPSVRLVLLTLGSSLVSGANYTVTVNGVKNLEGDPVSSNATVTFQATTTPHLVLTEPDLTSGNLVATFDRPMDPATAGNAAHYYVASSKGAVSTVTAATPLGPAFLPAFQGDRVRLAVGGLNSNAIYSLTVSNINSACGTGVSNGDSTSFVVAVSNPILSAQVSGANVLLSWTGTNFGLLETPNFDAPISWQPSSATLSILGNSVSTQVPIGPGTRFFRLLLQ